MTRVRIGALGSRGPSRQNIIMQASKSCLWHWGGREAVRPMMSSAPGHPSSVPGLSRDHAVSGRGCLEVECVFPWKPAGAGLLHDRDFRTGFLLRFFFSAEFSPPPRALPRALPPPPPLCVRGLASSRSFSPLCFPIRSDFHARRDDKPRPPLALASRLGAAVAVAGRVLRVRTPPASG